MNIFNPKASETAGEQRAEHINEHFGDESTFEVIFSGIMTRVYAYMFMGLIVTALVAWWVTGVDAFWTWLHYSAWGIWVVLLAPIALLLIMRATEKIASHALDVGMFVLFSAVFGLSMAVAVYSYTAASIVSTLALTCALFGAMSLYGFVTKKCLNSWGSFLFMGLIGIIGAAVINIFIMSDGLAFIISLVAVGVFLGLTAYDTQKIKNALLESPAECQSKKIAIQGAIMLYLNFLNLFLHLLRLFGDRD